MFEIFRRVWIYGIAGLLDAHVGVSGCGIIMCCDMLNKQV
jgi:hypothetical protein